MTTKKSLLIAFLLLIASFISSPVSTAFAQAPFLSFAGISEATGLKGLQLTDESASNERIVPQQFLSGSTIMAINISLPSKKTFPKSVKKTYVVPATGYSSTKDQTDDTPFITAMGTHVRDGVVAANFLPFGTVIKIPEIFGDKTFVVEDRMNKRYDYRIDLWFPSREIANQWGLRKVKIEIVS